MSFFSALDRSDPVPWLLASDEPAARWVTLLRVARPAGDPATADEAAETHEATAAHEAATREAAAAVHSAVVADPGTQRLLSLLPDWEADNGIKAHDKPLLATNLLDLLGEMGVCAGDDARIGCLLDQMLAHADGDGRFQMLAAERGSSTPCWAALLCDAHSITDVLLRYERGDDPRVHMALKTALADLRETAQGRAWPCRPPTDSTWRGPGRIGECCPQTTLEALHAFSWLPAAERPPEVAEAARAAVAVWRERTTHKPYMFGHGRQFKQVKWPPTWYGAYEFVDTIGRLPEVWSGAQAPPEVRAALAEVAACLLAYNVAADGTVTPLSTFQGFEEYSFGQKKRPSPLATALVWAALRRLEPLVDEIAAVDITTLASSKGGTGVPLPPKIARWDPGHRAAPANANG